MWYRGNLDYILHDGQRLIDKTLAGLTGQLRVICCSRQFGKTTWAVIKAISLAIKKSGSRIKIGAAFQSDLTELILPAFEFALRDCPLKLRPKYKVQGSKFVFSNGSEIKLVGLDKNVNGMRGQVPDMIILEEAGYIERLDELYESILSPATTHRPDCNIILISTPPSTPAHPFADTFVPRAQLEGSYASFTIYQNPMVNQATIDRLAKEAGGYNSHVFRREFLCEFIIDDNLALVREWNDRYIQEVPKDEYVQYYHTLVGQDLGRKDATALIFGYYDFKRAALVIQDELTMDGPSWTTITLKDAILAKEKELWGEVKPYRRVSDNNNPHLLQDLYTLHDVHFMPVKKDASLEQMVNRVREFVGAGRILINPKCKMLIGNMKYGLWDKNRKEFARSKIYGHFDHIAALQYLLIHTPVSANPIPAHHGHENHRSWLGNINNHQLSNNAKTIQRAFERKK